MSEVPGVPQPSRIPIFPLPNVVLFPRVFLPLHIFEPRYREMVADALDGERRIGMVLLRDGWQQHPDPNPPVFPVGCAGRITHVETLPEGRYNIVLRGVERFRVVDEDRSRSYRIATVEPFADTAVDDPDRLRDGRQRLEALLVRQSNQNGHAAAPRIPREMADAELVNALSQYLELAPIEKQALLECTTPCDRCSALIDLLEMRLASSGSSGAAGGVQ